MTIAALVAATGGCSNEQAEQNRKRAVELDRADRARDRESAANSPPVAEPLNFVTRSSGDTSKSEQERAATVRFEEVAARRVHERCAAHSGVFRSATYEATLVFRGSSPSER